MENSPILRKELEDYEKTLLLKPKSLVRQQAEHKPAVYPRSRGPTAPWTVLAGQRGILLSTC